MVNDGRDLRAAVVIPARNEAATVAEVVRAASRASLVDEVIVVDDGSVDDTGRVARAAGARVVRTDGVGKGEAMSAGVAATRADVLCFLDADLTGLRPEHVDRILGGVVERGAAMACGLFDRGPALDRVFLRFLPVLTGERALRREIFESLGPDEVRGYRVEAALNSVCAERCLPVEKFVCDGMFHRRKEEKYPSAVEGFIRKVAMLVVAMWSYVAYRIGRARRRSARRRSGGSAGLDRAA